jgi:hypothetical protein
MVNRPRSHRQRHYPADHRPAKKLVDHEHHSVSLIAPPTPLPPTRLFEAWLPPTLCGAFQIRRQLPPLGARAMYDGFALPTFKGLSANPNVLLRVASRAYGDSASARREPILLNGSHSHRQRHHPTDQCPAEEQVYHEHRAGILHIAAPGNDGGDEVNNGADKQHD